MDIELSQIIFQIINFGVVLFVLNRLLYRPVLKMLQERSKRVAEASKVAEENLAEKTKLKSLREQTVAEANKEATSILSKAKSAAAAEAGQLLAQSKAELASRRSKAEQELKALKQETLQKNEMVIRQAAVLIAEKIIKEKVDAKTQAKLIDRSLAEIVESL